MDGVQEHPSAPIEVAGLYAEGVATTGGRPGRPKAISREMLAEAACELFLEKGHDATSVTEIATRAGISRSSFFNYASSKAELLWGSFDERIAEADRAVDDGASPEEALRSIAAGFAPDTLALIIGNAEAMRIEEDLEREAAVRMWRITALAGRSLRRAGYSDAAAAVRGGAYGAAMMSSIWAWAGAGAGSAPLVAHLDAALAEVASPRSR